MRYMLNTIQSHAELFVKLVPPRLGHLHPDDSAMPIHSEQSAREALNGRRPICSDHDSAVLAVIGCRAS